MPWPWISRAAHEAEISALKAQLTAAEARARRRSARQAKPAKPVATTAPVFDDASPELPAVVVEAIDARAPNARIRSQMTQLAMKALGDGTAADQVAAYMWRGETD